jgi:hypothetical protein
MSECVRLILARTNQVGPNDYEREFKTFDLPLDPLLRYLLNDDPRGPFSIAGVEHRREVKR